jgi:endo-1,4-beta-xylanase
MTHTMRAGIVRPLSVIGATYLGVALALGPIGCSSASNDDGSGNTGGTAGAAGSVGPAGASAMAGAAPTGSGGSATPGGGGATGSGGSSVGGSAAGGNASGGSGTAGSGAGGGSGSGGSSGSGNGGASGGGGRSSGGASGAGGSSGGSAGSAGAAGAGGMTASKKFVGNITTNNAVRDGFAKYWDQITPENEGKWGSVQPSQGSFNWTALDKIHSYAQTNHVIFKQHNFVWGAQQPSWVNSGNAQTAVQAWMKAFCDRYPDVKLIDVVNEPPPHTTPGYISGMGGTGTTGYDWIVNAFKWARAACPNAILILNDYNNIEYGNDNSHTIDIVTKIKGAGAPIDAVGCQAHDAYKIATNTVKGFIDKISQQTGLPVYITEYDIGIADDNMQKMVMQDQITMYFNDDNVKGVTLWGYIVGSTWRANTGIQQPSGAMRPAMTWLMQFLGRPTT